jgi:MFS family permease
VSGFAGAFAVMTLGRMVSGLGGGLMIIAVYVIIGQAYPSQLQPVMFGWLAAAWVVPSLVGPFMAGLLAEHVSWRWVFIGVIPIVVLAVVLVWPRVGRLGPPAAPSLSAAAGRRRTLLGLGLAFGVLGLQWTANELADPASPLTRSFPALAVVLAVVGVGIMALTAPRLLPPGFFRLARGLPSVVVTRGVLALAFFGSEVFIPLMLVKTHGLDAASAGLTLTGGAIGWSIGSFVQARVKVERHWLLVSGSVLAAAALAVMALLSSSGAPVVALMLTWSVSGFAMGLALSTTSVMVLNLSTPEDRGRNSASLQLSDILGSVIGTAGAGTVFAAMRDPLHPEQIGVFVVIWASLAAFAVVGVFSGLRSAAPASGRSRSATV